MNKNHTAIILLLFAIIVVLSGIFFFVKKPSIPASSQNGTATSTEKTYLDPSLHYSIRYPADFSPNTAYSYTALGPGKDIHGVSFTVPSSMSAGTNLSSDTYLSVESMATSTCSALAFLDEPASTSTQTIVENGTTYEIAKGGGAAAGNFYEEYVYALPKTNPCIAIRYFIHSTNIGNYPPNTVKAYDKEALLSSFDEMRRSFTLNP